MTGNLPRLELWLHAWKVSTYIWAIQTHINTDVHTSHIVCFHTDPYQHSLPHTLNAFTYVLHQCNSLRILHVCTQSHINTTHFTNCMLSHNPTSTTAHISHITCIHAETQFKIQLELILLQLHLLFCRHPNLKQKSTCLGYHTDFTFLDSPYFHSPAHPCNHPRICHKSKVKISLWQNTSWFFSEYVLLLVYLIMLFYNLTVKGAWKIWWMLLPKKLCMFRVSPTGLQPTLDLTVRPLLWVLVDETAG